MTKNTAKSLFWSFVLFLLLTFLDQYTKIWARSALHLKKPFVIINGVFEFNYLEGGNKGAAWGFLSGHLLLLSLISLIVIVIIWIYIFKVTSVIDALKSDNKDLVLKYKVFRLVLVFLNAGAFGNLIDRLFRKYVIDFLYFKLINFPIFNVADCYVVISVIILAIMLMFVFKEEELKDLSILSKNNKRIDI